MISFQFLDTERPSTDEPQILKNAIVQFDEYFKGTRRDFDIQYMMQGSKFQRKVWNLLRV